MIDEGLMGTTDRPRSSLLLVLGLGAVVVVLGVLVQLDVLRTGGPWLPVAVGLLVAAVVYTLLRHPVTAEDIWGVVTPLAVITAAGVAKVAVIDPFAEWLWAQFLLCVALVVLAQVLAALEWSQRWFLATGLVLVALLVALLVRVGFQAENDARFVEPITAAVEETVDLEAQAAADVEAKEAALQTASDAATDELAQVLPDASESFRSIGEAILLGLTSADTEDLAANVARMRALPVSSDLATQDLLVRAAAVDAADAFAANARGVEPPSSDAVLMAIADACRVADQEGVEITACEEREGDSGATPPPSDSAVAIHRLDVALAFYRSAVSPDDESLEDAAEAAAAAEPEDLETTLFDALTAGPRVVIASIDPDSALRLVPGPLGWLVLGVLALWTLRRLLELNAMQMPGPVEVKYDGDHMAALRIAVLQNLKTPAASPGSAVVQSVTDLSALTGPESKGIAAVAAAVTSVFSSNRGYVVTAELSPPPAASTTTSADEEDGTEETPGPTTVLVSVRAASSDESLGSQSFTDESPEKAMRAAGLWAAGFLLERSTRIPKWASWTAATARSLDATVSTSPTLAQLELAARGAPTSGWILQLYGHELELATRELEAIAVYARAVVVHPRYLVARYRLAAALGMLGRDISRWTTATYAERAAIGKTVDDACARLGLAADLESNLQGPDVTEADFRLLAETLLRSIEDDSQLWHHGAALLRRSDRDQSWLAWRGRHSSRRSTLWLARSGRLIYLDDSTERTKLGRKVETQARKPSSSWQLSYNLACAHAASSPDAALAWLEACLMRPGVQELNAKWVRSDEDLEPLRSHPRFDRFCAQVEQRVEEGAT